MCARPAAVSGGSAAAVSAGSEQPLGHKQQVGPGVTKLRVLQILNVCSLFFKFENMLECALSNVRL